MGIWGLPHMRGLGPNLNSQAHLPVPLEASSKEHCPEKCWPLQAIPCSFSGLRGAPLHSEQHQGRCWQQPWLQRDVLMRLQWQTPLLKLQPSSTTVQPRNNSRLITTSPESPMQFHDNSRIPGCGISRLVFPWLVIGKLELNVNDEAQTFPFIISVLTGPYYHYIKFRFRQKAMQRMISQHKHFFVLNILKSLLIRYPVSRPHPGFLTWGIKSPLKVYIGQWGQTILPNKARCPESPYFPSLQKIAHHD